MVYVRQTEIKQNYYDFEFQGFSLASVEGDSNI